MKGSSDGAGGRGGGGRGGGGGGGVGGGGGLWYPVFNNTPEIVFCFKNVVEMKKRKIYEKEKNRTFKTL